MITKQDVKRGALAARLELAEDEKDLYTKQLNEVLKHASKLQALNTDGVSPTMHILPLKNIFREDQVGDHMPNEMALANAPDTEGNFIKVPKIM